MLWIRVTNCEEEDVQVRAAMKSSSVLIPLGPKAVPSSELAPEMMGTLTKLPERSWVDVRPWIRSWSMAGPQLMNWV